MKIVLAGLHDVANLGDPILFESTEYLLSKIEDVNIKRMNLFGETKGLKNYLVRAINKFLSVSKMNTQSEKFVTIKMKVLNYDLRKYYYETLKDADGLVLAGGGLLKYKYETFDLRIAVILDVAEELNIPVFFNAVGVEGYEKNNYRCQFLKKNMNKDIIYGVTTRDDIDRLTDNYIENKNIVKMKVADSAFWVDEVYGVRKNVASKKIGVGLSRGEIFIDNGVDMNEDSLLEFWFNIVRELDKKEQDWELFTNGLESDNVFLRKLITKLETEGFTNIKYSIPTESLELVKIISEYSSIICTRMHASIVAYSLNIPTIGVVWNNKIKYFGEEINHPERFYELSQFDPKAMVEQLLEIKNDEKDIEHKLIQRESTARSLKEFVNYCRVRD